jgi:hypothetical protein
LVSRNSSVFLSSMLAGGISDAAEGMAGDALDIFRGADPLLVHRISAKRMLGQ